MQAELLLGVHTQVSNNLKDIQSLLNNQKETNSLL
jgi:hypothetical protein